MATYTQKIEAERRVRDLLEREGLPLPDRIEYGHGCIRLLWLERKLALVVDIDEPPEAIATSDPPDEAMWSEG